MQPEPAPQRFLCTIACAVATAVAAVRTLGDLRGSRIAVFGGGPLGLFAAARAAEQGAAHVTVVDPAPGRDEIIASFGFATELSGVYDGAIEACGAVGAVRPAVDCVRVGATVTLVGLVHPNSDLKGACAAARPCGAGRPDAPRILQA